MSSNSFKTGNETLDLGFQMCQLATEVGIGDEQLTKEIVKGHISKQLEDPESHLSNLDSPTTKAFVEVSRYIKNHVRSDKAESIQSQLTDNYISKRLGDSCSSARRSLQFHPGPSSPEKITRKPPPPVLGAETPNPGLTKKPRVKDGHLSFSSCNRHCKWLDKNVTLKTNYANLAKALVAIGPNKKVDTNSYAPKQLVPEGMQCKVYNCICTRKASPQDGKAAGDLTQQCLCTTRKASPQGGKAAEEVTEQCPGAWLVVSPSNEEFQAGPVNLYHYRAHWVECKVAMASWQQWYQLKVDFTKAKSQGRAIGCSWDELNPNWAKAPGLPESIKSVCIQIIKNRNTVSAGALFHEVERSVPAMELFREVSGCSAILKKQVEDFHKNNQNRLTGRPPSRKIQYVSEFCAFKDQNRLKHEILRGSPSNGLYNKRMVFDVHQRQSYAAQLVRDGVIPPPSQYSRKSTKESLDGFTLENRLFTLVYPEIYDDPELNRICDSNLVGDRESPNTFMVFSSLSCLSNLCDCVRLKFEVQISADGTHSIGKSKYILLIVGLVSIDRHGTHQFRPLCFSLVPTETMLGMLVLLLSLRHAVKDLFGFTDDQLNFKGGAVSDHAAAIVSPIKYVFPGTTPLQCYAHIHRKFQGMDPCTNAATDYVKYVKGDTRWLPDVALEDLHTMYLSPTMPCFVCVSSIEREAWVRLHDQQRVVDVFFPRYVDDPDYNKWYYSASGLHGCEPMNNVLECFNKLSKGSGLQYGMFDPHTTLGILVHQQLPELVSRCWPKYIGVERNYPICDLDQLMQMSEFTEVFGIYKREIHCQCLDPDTDQQAHDYDTSKANSLLVVDFRNKAFRECISNGCFPKEEAYQYSDLLRGICHILPENRYKIRHLLTMFHVMHRVPHPYNPGQTVFRCNCVYYFKKNYCIMSAVETHYNEAKHRLTKMPKTKSQSSRLTNKQANHVAIRKAHRELKLREQQRRQAEATTAKSGNVNRVSQANRVPAILTQDDEP